MGQWPTGMTMRVSALALCVQLFVTNAPVALAQQPGAQPAPPAAGRGGRGPVPVDPRVQMREYFFSDMSEKIEVPGGDHGSVISIGMPDIFKFFDTHSKPAPR